MSTKDPCLFPLPKARPFDDSLPWSKIYLRSSAEGISFDRVELDSPIGVLTIESKGDLLFSILINGYWIQDSNSLEEAKKMAREYLEVKAIDLSKFLNTRK